VKEEDVSAMTWLDQEMYAADGEYEDEGTDALGELEDEWELEAEMEWESGPTGAGSTALLMEHLGSLAAEAESEAEAEAFLGALVPLAAKLAPVVARAAPAIVRGVARVGGQLWRNPATRRMVRAVPQVVQRTAADLARQHARGRPLTSQAATRALARQTAAVMGSPARRRSAVRRGASMDRRWRQQQRAAAARAGAHPDIPVRRSTTPPCVCR
jgi:hypothetical protein